MLKPYPKEELDRMSKREIIRLYKQIVEQFNYAGLVRRGKWTADETLYTHGMAVCSYCKTEYYRDDLYMVGNDAQGELPNYCPNCGADMRGEKQ